jgi:rhomboid protease GluP
MASSPAQAPVTSVVLLINLAVFGLMLAFGASVWHTTGSVPLAWGANFGPATQDKQWWRLATAMFVHFGFVHLALNMLALWDVGRLVERLHGRWRFGVLYAGSGVAGNLLSLAVQGNQAVSGGASGAVFGLYGALLVFLWRERGQVERQEFRWMFGAAALFATLALGMGQVVAGIDNAAHLGGLLAGALLGGALARPLTQRSPAPRRGWAIAGLSLAIGLLVLRMPEPSYLLADELRARDAIQQFLSTDQQMRTQWRAILAQGRRQGVSFDDLAGSIETDITPVYQHSFEQLTAAYPGAVAPSANALEALQAYASARAEASLEAAQQLRSGDFQEINKALTRRPASLVVPAPMLSKPGVAGGS